MFDRAGSRKYLNGNERQKLLAAIEAEPDTVFRTFALALFYTGCRISEGLSVTVDRVDLSQKALVFETLKQRRPGQFRAVPIPDTLCDLMRPLLVGREASDRVWRFSRATAYRHIKSLMQQADVSGSMACPRGLRHGMAVACLAQLIPLTTVQKWLGHARLETTAIYLAVTGEEERQLASRLWTQPEGLNTAENGLHPPIRAPSST